MEAVGVAKKSKIRSEMQLIEIDAAVGQPIRRDAHGVEAEDLCPCGEIGLELSDHAFGVKRSDEHRASARIGEFCRASARVSKEGLANASLLLDVGAGDVDFVEVENFVEAVGRSAGIVHGNRRIPPEGSDK